MSVLFNHACRYELYSENPIRLVRQSSKRRKVPQILHVDEIKQLLDGVGSLTRLLIFLDVTTGLRQSELFGLQWSDLDFDNGEISVVRSVVHGVISRCKTESSSKPIPMDPLLAEMLTDWRKVTCYRSADDWVFASQRAKGKRPIWGQSIMRKQIHPAIEKLGIKKRIGLAQPSAFLFHFAPTAWHRLRCSRTGGSWSGEQTSMTGAWAEKNGNGREATTSCLTTGLLFLRPSGLVLLRP